MRYAWIGTPNDPTESIVHRGIEFFKGKMVTIPDDHEFAADFKSNPAFTAEPKEAKAALDVSPVDPAPLPDPLTASMGSV